MPPIGGRLGWLANRIRHQGGSYKSDHAFPNSRQHKGEPKLPFKSLHVLFLIVVGRSVVVFGNRSLSSVFSDPHPGYKSKRIFLSAYLLRSIA
jgi:hypothetical protein